MKFRYSATHKEAYVHERLLRGDIRRLAILSLLSGALLTVVLQVPEALGEDDAALEGDSMCLQDTTVLAATAEFFAQPDACDTASASANSSSAAAMRYGIGGIIWKCIKKIGDIVCGGPRVKPPVKPPGKPYPPSQPVWHWQKDTKWHDTRDPDWEPPIHKPIGSDRGPRHEPKGSRVDEHPTMMHDDTHSEWK